MKNKLTSMVKLNEGVTLVEDVINEIEQHFLYNGTNKEVVCSQILAEIGNYKGDWHFHFKSIPESKVLMFIISLFDGRYAFDGIRQIVFNHNKHNEKVFADLAGSCQDYNNQLEILKCSLSNDKLVDEANIAIARLKHSNKEN